MASAGLPTLLLTLPEDTPSGGRYFRLAAGIIAAVLLGASLRLLAEVPSLIYHGSDLAAEPQQTSEEAKEPLATETTKPAPMEAKEPLTTEATNLAPVSAPLPAKSLPPKPAIQFPDAVTPGEPKRKYTFQSQRRGWYLPRDRGRWYGYSTRDTSGL
jgi:hypothetical protein